MVLEAILDEGLEILLSMQKFNCLTWGNWTYRLYQIVKRLARGQPLKKLFMMVQTCMESLIHLHLIKVVTTLVKFKGNYCVESTKPASSKDIALSQSTLSDL